jgi:hypothetical protein
VEHWPESVAQQQDFEALSSQEASNPSIPGFPLTGPQLPSEPPVRQLSVWRREGPETGEV